MAYEVQNRCLLFNVYHWKVGLGPRYKTVAIYIDILKITCSTECTVGGGSAGLFLMFLLYHAVLRHN